MILNIRIYGVVEIPIFGFNKYWQAVFGLNDINIRLTFQKLSQENIYTNKDKAYYQQYNINV